ncbi:MAG: Mini-ribonuclease 3 [Clostridia bacterium]|nr:Mini-ribonuclease 3 [Clostridia bacterium]
MGLLFQPIKKEKMVQMPVLTLAHMGDCVFELMARSYVANQGIFLAKTAHQKTVHLVSARAQCKMIHGIMDKLTEEEKAYYMRGRNSKPKTMSKNADISEYLAATGLETLFGALYFEGKQERIEELFALCIEVQEGKVENI